MSLILILLAGLILLLTFVEEIRAVSNFLFSWWGLFFISVLIFLIIPLFLALLLRGASGSTLEKIRSDNRGRGVNRRRTQAAGAAKRNIGQEVSSEILRASNLGTSFLAARSISQGLVIIPDAVDLILCGEKAWEVRTTRTTKRGKFALIKKGTKTVYGVATLVDVVGPLSFESLINSKKTGSRELGFLPKDAAKYKFAWQLEDVVVLERPVPYIHKAGSVIWVNLDQEAARKVSEQL